MPPKKKVEETVESSDGETDISEDIEDTDGETDEENNNEDDNENENEEESKSESEESKNDDNDNDNNDGGDENEDCMYNFRGKKNNDQENDDDFEEYFDEDIEEITENKDQEGIVVPKNERITKPILFNYERVRLKGDRAKQLIEGAKPMIKGVEKIDPKDIAQMEIDKKVVPIILRRTRPDGKIEEWSISELKIIQNN
jgi:DNA-directed RNA polymerase subunit K/omega